MGKHNIYLDTNIVADLLDPSRKGHKISLALLNKLLTDSWNIYISEDMLSTLYYISADKKAALEFFKNVIFKDWNVSAYGIETMQEAVGLSLCNSLDLEDILQCLCAKKNSSEILITNDKQFYDCGVGILTAEVFLERNE